MVVTKCLTRDRRSAAFAMRTRLEPALLRFNSRRALIHEPRRSHASREAVDKPNVAYSLIGKEKVSWPFFHAAGMVSRMILAIMSLRASGDMLPPEPPTSSGRKPRVLLA